MMRKNKDIGRAPILKSLAPRDNVNIEKYSQYLEDMFLHRDVFNVGLTGPYGSGKSSTIESYKKKTPDKKFIHISLGKYDSVYDEGKVEINEREMRKSTKEIEGKIINQLLHQVDIKKVPQAFAKVKKNNSNVAIVMWSFLVPIIISLIAYVTMYNYWANFVSNTEAFTFLSPITNPMTRVISALILLLFVGCLTYKFGEAQVNRSIIRKISIRGNEIELFKNNKNSFFDEHLNEVVYLFENSKADVIVFEDLDRYNNPDVFRKLRELNQLINRRISDNLTEQDSKKKLIFMYLIKDDIFVSKDRTKFFDLIIPIIPVVTSTNSYEKIIDIFKEDISEKDCRSSKVDKDLLSKSFLRKLSIYIDDMRLIMNIYNEYKIYDSTINTADLNKNRLLAMITYKNVFPRDFSDLQYSKGFVYSTIHNKEALLTIKNDKLNREIESLEGELSDLERERSFSIEELKIIYLKTDGILVEDNSEVAFNSREEYVREILKGKPLTKETYSPYNSSSGLFRKNKNSITLDRVIESLDNNEEYKKRKQNIEANDNSKKEQLRSSIAQLQVKKIQVKITPLSEMFDENLFNASLISEEYKDIKNNEYYMLLSFLLKEGYIDETYDSYMNYFYENDLRKEDIIFLRELYASSSMDPSYKLNKLDSIIDILEMEDYTRKGILNYSLFEYLLDKKNEKSMRDIIIVAFQQNESQYIFNLYIYLKSKRKLDNPEDIDLWTNTLCDSWNGFYSQIIQKDSFFLNVNPEEKRRFQDLMLFETLCYAHPEKIFIQNSDGVLSSYIEKNSLVLQHVNKKNWDTLNVNLYQNLEKLQVEFEIFNTNNTYDDLIDLIIENNFYQLNYQNIENIAMFKNIINQSSDIDSFKHENLTYIMSSELTALKARISTNLNSYMEIYLNFSSDRIYDTEEVILQVLNSDSNGSKTRYIEATKHKINNIENVDDKELWINLIKNDSVFTTIENIVSYYIQSGKEWTVELIDFVNRCQERIEVDYDEVIDKFEIGEFFGKTTKLNALRDDRYEDIVGMSDYSIEDIKILSNNIDSSKLNILTNHSVIPMSVVNLSYIRTYYPDKSVQFALKHFEEYVELINSNFNENEVLGLLNSNLSNEEKEELLSKIETSKKISIKDIEPSSENLYTVIDNHLKTNDIPLLFRNYSKYKNKIREKIFDISKDNIEILKTNDCDKKLVIAVLMSDVSKIYKEQVLKMKVSTLDYDDIVSLISAVDLSENYRELSKGKWPKFDNNDLNNILLNRLETLGIISSFDVLKDRKITARGRK